ncbi:MAG: T9SS type A sorting domain-containing protein [Candidatus Marinimicrobia bacterium]|nr:T9SS type A sorting domain-containing protein [Candidatus Neomarinimicrobiota bacterium]MCF7880607.1 T9SS type A sorting domain-containing protein [Candidatus Neomarinimicrobiota bacterium]
MFSITAVLICAVQVDARTSSPATIYLDSTEQVIRGFGAANILPWRPDMTSGEIQKAFGTAEGQLGFSILRLRIPLQENEYSQNLATAQAAHSMGAKIIASPWSPPAHMKSNNSTIGGRLSENSYDDYAAHLKSFADYMADNGVPLYAISVQNEPDVEVSYESCDWNAEEMTRFLKENAESIGVPVIAPESYNFNKTISNLILNDSIAAAHLSIVGGHLYGGGLDPYPLAWEKGKELWMTEHLDTDISWSAVLGTGKEIHDCMVSGMNAYIWWYIVRFYGPIHDGEDWQGDDIEDNSEKGEITKRGNIMSQYSRFIRPGYIRVNASVEPRAQVYVSAYTTDSTIVIVAINTGDSSQEQTFTLDGGSASYFSRYVTSERKNAEQVTDITVSGGSFTATLDKESVTTFVSEDRVTGVTESSKVPKTFHLSQNYPNPFNPETTIEFMLNQDRDVTLVVYNSLGRQVAQLANGKYSAGQHKVTFHAFDLPSGIYFYKMMAGGHTQMKKLVLLK